MFSLLLSATAFAQVPHKNWTEAELKIVKEAARQFYIPPWLSEAIWVFENGVPGYEGGQSTQSRFSTRWMPNAKARQLFTMHQTIRRGIKSYFEKPYVRTAWASGELSESDFLWRYRTDFLRHLASEWKPRQKDQSPSESEGIWAFGVRRVAEKRRK